MGSVAHTLFQKCYALDLADFGYLLCLLIVIIFLSDHGMTTRNATAPEGYVCDHKLDGGLACGEQFPTRHLRATHKKETGHTKPRKKKNAN